MPGRAVLFLSHGDPVALRLAASCALTAAAAGDRVDVFAFGPAVATLAEARGEPDHPAAPLFQARASGALRLYACSASVVEERLDLARAEAAFDAVVGWPTVVEWTRGVVERFFF